MSSVFETGCLSLAWKVAKVRLPNSRDKQMNHKYYYYQMLKKNIQNLREQNYEGEVKCNWL